MRQESLGGVAEGNTIFVDQSLASGALVAGDLTGDRPALQFGARNAAEVRVTGDDATVVLSQGRTGNPAFDNEALIDVGGLGALAGLVQLGDGNFADLDVTGARSIGTILQVGDDNRADLDVTGRRSIGILNQIGDDNDTSLAVTSNRTAVTYTVVGDGVTTAVSPSVSSNGGTVVITQTSFGSFTTGR